MATRTQWPGLRKLRLRGGPHGNVVEVQLDGEKLQRCSRVVVDAGVGDAVRIITYQFAEVDVEIEGKVEDAGLAYEASVAVFDPPELNGRGQPTIRIPANTIRVKADTPWQALYDAARQLELEAARAENMRDAQTGTIPASGDSQPGHTEVG